MKKIILVRHAKTKKAKSWQVDRERKLSKKWKLQLQYINYVFKYFWLNWKIFCSPSIRTRQTLDWILKNNNFLTFAPIFDEKLYSWKIEDFVTQDWEYILVSHEPKISGFLKKFWLNLKIETWSISILEIENEKLVEFSYFSPKLKK